MRSKKRVAVASDRFPEKVRVAFTHPGCFIGFNCQGRNEDFAEVVNGIGSQGNESTFNNTACLCGGLITGDDLAAENMKPVF